MGGGEGGGEGGKGEEGRGINLVSHTLEGGGERGTGKGVGEEGWGKGGRSREEGRLSCKNTLLQSGYIVNLGASPEWTQNWTQNQA